MEKWFQNPLKRFLTIFIGVYLLVLGMGSFAGLGNAYQGMMRGITGSLFQKWWSEGYVFVKDGIDPTNKGMDTAFHLVNRKAFHDAQKNNTNVYTVTVYQSMWQAGYLMTAFFLALVLASPVPRKRLLIAGAIGLILVQLFLLFRLWINMDFSFQQSPKLAVVEHGETLKSFMVTMDALFMKNIVISFIVPLLIWILVTFTKEDRSRLMEIMRKPKAA